MNVNEEIMILEDRKDKLLRELEEVSSDITDKQKEIKEIKQLGTDDDLEKVLKVIKKITLFPVYLLSDFYKELALPKFSENGSKKLNIKYLIADLFFGALLVSIMSLYVLCMALIVAVITGLFSIPLIYLGIFMSVGVLAEGISRGRKGILALSRRKYTSDLRKLLKKDKNKMRELKNKIRKIIIELNIKQDEKRKFDKMQDKLNAYKYLKCKENEGREELLDERAKAEIDLAEKSNGSIKENDVFFEKIIIDIKRLIDKLSPNMKIKYQAELDKILKERMIYLNKCYYSDERLRISHIVASKLLKLKYTLNEILLSDNLSDIASVVGSINLEDSFVVNLYNINMVVKGITKRRNKLGLLAKNELDSYIASIYIDAIKRSFVNGDFDVALLKKIEKQYIIAISSVIEHECEKVRDSDNILLKRRIESEGGYKDSDTYRYISNVLYLLNNNKEESRGRVKRLNMGN